MTGEWSSLLVGECGICMMASAWRVRNLEAGLCFLSLLRISYWDFLLNRLWISLCRTCRWINIEWLADRKLYIDVPTIAGSLLMSFAIAVHDKEVVFLFLIDGMRHQVWRMSLRVVVILMPDGVGLGLWWCVPRRGIVIAFTARCEVPIIVLLSIVIISWHP